MMAIKKIVCWQYNLKPYRLFSFFNIFVDASFANFFKHFSGGPRNKLLLKVNINNIDKEQSHWETIFSK